MISFNGSNIQKGNTVAFFILYKMACFKNNPHTHMNNLFHPLQTWISNIHLELFVEFNNHISVTEHCKCEVSTPAQENQDEKSHGNLNSIPSVHKYDKFSRSFCYPTVGKN